MVTGCKFVIHIAGRVCIGEGVVEEAAARELTGEPDGAVAHTGELTGGEYDMQSTLSSSSSNSSPSRSEKSSSLPSIEGSSGSSTSESPSSSSEMASITSSVL